MPIFVPLPIHTDGYGEYRLNRFRLYFTIPPHRLSPDGLRLNGGPHGGHPIANLGGLLAQNFPSCFNPNVATVSFQPTRPWGGQRTLRFEITATLAGHAYNSNTWHGTLSDYLAPDLHSDWVGIQWSDPSVGFTVQTLKRNFSETEDYLATAGALIGTPIATTAGGAVIGGTAGGISGGISTGGAGIGPGALAGAGTGAEYGLATGVVAAPIVAAMTHDINQHHFLAGRRSWAVKPAAWFGNAGVQNPSAIPPNTYAIETAAIERFSHLAFHLMDQSQLLGDFDDTLRHVWGGLLNNYMHYMGFTPLPNIRVWHHTHSLPAGVPRHPGSMSVPISFTEGRYADRSLLERSPEYAAVISKFQQIYPP